jgi:hypothetical protein
MVSKWPKDKCNFTHKKIKSSPGLGVGNVKETGDRRRIGKERLKGSDSRMGRRGA